MHTIQNDFFSVSIKKTGAELCNIKSRKTGKEYMWQANPNIWGSHAPVLFPIIGCLKEGAFIYNGKEYKTPKHGFIRHNKEVTLKEQTDHSLTFNLISNKNTRKIYPFEFDFTIEFVLKENKIEVKHTIINLGKETMLFSLGGHPAFKCPVNDGEEYSDYYLEFQQKETAVTHQVTPNGLISKTTRPVMQNVNRLDLNTHLFDDDALIFKNLKSSSIAIKSRKSSQKLTLTFPDFPYVGIWAKPNANFVCIEPWLGIADNFDTDRKLENKEGILQLEAGKTFEAMYQIEIEEE